MPFASLIARLEPLDRVAAFLIDQVADFQIHDNQEAPEKLRVFEGARAVSQDPGVQSVDALARQDALLLGHGTLAASRWEGGSLQSLKWEAPEGASRLCVVCSLVLL